LKTTSQKNINLRPAHLVGSFSVLILILLLLIFPGSSESNKIPIDRVEEDTVRLTPVVETRYGYPVEPYDLIYGRVSRNQYLSGILYRYNVSSQTVHEITRKSKNIFDVRNIRQGNHYTLFCSKDSLSTAQIFVYEHTPTEFFVIDLRDSILVTKREKEVAAVQKTARGTIETSLWYAMTDSGINPILAIELSEIFAWSIDFFGLQKGDEFKVMYEEQYIDTLSVGLGKIYAAWFKHAGEEFYAIPFIQDGEESYYHTDGQSLKKAFLKAPLRFSRISSGFSHSRLHPILKIRRPHYGVDYAAPIGTPVHAIGDGKVIQMGRNGDAGNMVKIRHNSVYTTAYLHLSHYAQGMYTGKYVKQGETIGYVGSSGLSTGPHLDFRFYRNGSPINPLTVKAPPVQPIKEENLETFNKVKEVIVEVLNTF